MRFETRCVQTGVEKDSTYKSVTTPIYPTSTFEWDDFENFRGHDYTRTSNPTRSALQENIASLEGGSSCRATSTGMSAITAAMHLFEPGDHIVTGDDIYGGTFRLFNEILTKWGLTFSFVKMHDLAAVKAAVTPKTKGFWIETPSNPLLNITDIRSVVAIAEKINAITIADNTFLSPYLQRPLELGVDVVMHSTTKYLNGHSDVVGGCIVTKKKEHAKQISYAVNALGVSCSPFDAWLVLRGIKTLGPRMEAHLRGATAVSEMLNEHPNVEQVFYPGLPNHPHHALAKSQQDGFGGMLSFNLKGTRDDVKRVTSKTKLFALAESLGGVESLIAYPATMSHATLTAEERQTAGILDTTIRLSIGIEHPKDLIADLQQALEK